MEPTLSHFTQLRFNVQNVGKLHLLYHITIRDVEGVKSKRTELEAYPDRRNLVRHLCISVPRGNRGHSLHELVLFTILPQIPNVHSLYLFGDCYFGSELLDLHNIRVLQCRRTHTWNVKALHISNAIFRTPQVFCRLVLLFPRLSTLRIVNARATTDSLLTSRAWSSTQGRFQDRLGSCNIQVRAAE